MNMAYYILAIILDTFPDMFYFSRFKSTCPVIRFLGFNYLMVSSDKLKLLPWHAISLKVDIFFILRNTINSYAASAPKAKFVCVLEKLKCEHKQ